MLGFLVVLIYFACTCMHVCVCAYMYIWGMCMVTHVLEFVGMVVIVFVCTCMWRPEVDMEYLP